MSGENLPNRAQVESLIQGYVDGTLSPEEAGRLKNALEHDPSLVGTVLEDLQTDALIRSVVSQADWMSSTVEAERLVENPSNDRSSRGDEAQISRFSRTICRRSQSLLTSSATQAGSEGPSHKTVDARTWFLRVDSRTWLPIAACIAALAVSIFLPQTAQPVLVGSFDGFLEVKRGAEVLRPSAGFKPQPNDFFTLSGTNPASLTYTSENTQIEFAPGSQWKILPWQRGKHFFLQSGKLEASVAHQRPFRPMIINTPQAQARVLGTRFTLVATTNSTRLDVTQGKVRFFRISNHAAVKVSAGQYAVAALNYELAALPFTGTILREWWGGVSSIDALRDDPRFPAHPDKSDLAARFELAPVNTNRLAVRICGYLHPPITGDYEISLSGPLVTHFGSTLLSMSPSENPEDKGAIARVGDWAHSQASPPISLVAGRRYYIEAIVVITQGEGSLSVEWKRPGGSRELLTGEFLSPFKLPENQP